MKKTLLLLLALLLMAAPVYAGPSSVPNGPWLKDTQNMKLERLHNYEELVKRLQQIEQNSHGNLELETIGKSNEQRDIYLAKVGSGSKKVMYITQQHGNEPLTTEAALQMLDRLSSSNHPDIEKIRQEVTLSVIVRANPDGTERFWRYNYDPDANPEYGSAGKGYDINRYHDPALSPGENPVPESAAIRRAYDKYQPDLVVDYHHQGTYVDEDGKMIKTSVFWPSHPDVSRDAIKLSKQTSVLIYDTLEHYGFANVSQYPGGNYQAIARNAYGLLGSGSVLVELRGGIGQKSSGMLIRTAYASMFSVLESVAEETLKEVDPSRADAIPERGEYIDGSE
ncbi:zinc carboxypeptidase [Melghirimyces profundicolus]|uniref:Zinc carboxypeptidase n=1 Tax=Melghirimyces profundicolus TaxID=1242148 RepID=A0A2T6C0H5_9BACL|nr:M14 family zinc carboxypeptidase [Melghirimyces profundicolus]PTX61825.1 zinc carboxypeptidase [Melghirimyces profundicolus]